MIVNIIGKNNLRSSGFSTLALRRVKEVTTVNTICELMNLSSFGKTIFSVINKLLHLYQTVPMTSSTAERSFSALRRIKDYLRSTMTQAWLNHLMFIKREQTILTYVADIAKTFVSLICIFCISSLYLLSS